MAELPEEHGPGRLRSLWHMAALGFRADPLRATGSLVAMGVASAAMPAGAYFASR